MPPPFLLTGFYLLSLDKTKSLAGVNNSTDWDDAGQSKNTVGKGMVRKEVG